jgi:hypothetical protein
MSNKETWEEYLSSFMIWKTFSACRKSQVVWRNKKSSTPSKVSLLSCYHIPSLGLRHLTSSTYAKLLRERYYDGNPCTSVSFYGPDEVIVIVETRYRQVLWQVVQLNGLCTSTQLFIELCIFRIMATGTVIALLTTLACISESSQYINNIRWFAKTRPSLNESSNGLLK